MPEQPLQLPKHLEDQITKAVWPLFIEYMRRAFIEGAVWRAQIPPATPVTMGALQVAANLKYPEGLPSDRT